MSQNDTTHVQTELEKEEYETFRALARERGLTVKEAGREALVTWIDRQHRVDPRDKVFTVLNELDEISAVPADTDARREGDVIEEWSGDDIDVRLAENPSPEC